MRSMMLAAALLSVATAAHAQNTPKPRPELGVRAGFVVMSEDGESINRVGIPGSDLFGVGTIHFMTFAAPSFAIEPQLGLTRVSSNGNSSGIVTGSIQLNQFLQGASGTGVFAFLHGGVLSGFGSSGGDAIWAAGGGAGYRVITYGSLGLRAEARYRRIMGNGAGANEFALLLGFGAVLGEGS